MLSQGSLEPSLLAPDGSSPESSSERLSPDGKSIDGSLLSSRLPLGSCESLGLSDSLSSRESLLASMSEPSSEGSSLPSDRESTEVESPDG
ncbi:hypothetical protein Mal65_16980 [Crateriforma conspicua]|nr:hypothetical protein Mal65_16980 [Crateriforma conspicua]